MWGPLGREQSGHQARDILGARAAGGPATLGQRRAEPSWGLVSRWFLLSFCPPQDQAAEEMSGALPPLLCISRQPLAAGLTGVEERGIMEEGSLREPSAGQSWRAPEHDEPCMPMSPVSDSPQLGEPVRGRKRALLRTPRPSRRDTEYRFGVGVSRLRSVLGTSPGCTHTRLRIRGFPGRRLHGGR